MSFAAARSARSGELERVSQNVRWNYRQLRERVTSMAAALLRLGLMPGDSIGIWSHNCAEWVVTQLATARAGFGDDRCHRPCRCVHVSQ